MHGRGGEQDLGQKRDGQERHQDETDHQFAGHPDGASGRQGQETGTFVLAAPDNLLCRGPEVTQDFRLDLQARDETQGRDAALSRSHGVEAGEGKGNGAAAVPDLSHSPGRVQKTKTQGRCQAPAAAAHRGTNHPVGAPQEAAERTVLLQTAGGAQPERAQVGLHYRGLSRGGGGGESDAL